MGIDGVTYISSGITEKRDIRIAPSPVNDDWLDVWIRDSQSFSGNYKLVATLTKKDQDKIVQAITKHQKED